LQVIGWPDRKTIPGCVGNSRHRVLQVADEGDKKSPTPPPFGIPGDLGLHAGIWCPGLLLTPWTAIPPRVSTLLFTFLRAPNVGSGCHATLKGQIPKNDLETTSGATRKLRMHRSPFQDAALKDAYSADTLPEIQRATHTFGTPSSQVNVRCFRCPSRYRPLIKCGFFDFCCLTGNRSAIIDLVCPVICSEV